jgi:hypothetical protein
MVAVRPKTGPWGSRNQAKNARSKGLMCEDFHQRNVVGLVLSVWYGNCHCGGASDIVEVLDVVELQ